MPKRTIEQEYRRLWNSGHADISERERTIKENQELRAECADLRKRYEITFSNIQEQVHWFETQPIEILSQFANEVKAIREKYCIGERVSGAFWSVVWNLPASGWKTHNLGSMPKIHFEKGKGFTVLITPETDIRNEFVIEFIETIQKNTLTKPPQPTQINGSRKLNWRPVWEWSLRHPQVTIKEIAQKLNRNYTDVKRRLKELGREIESPF